MWSQFRASCPLCLTARQPLFLCPATCIQKGHVFTLATPIACSNSRSLCRHTRRNCLNFPIKGLPSCQQIYSGLLLAYPCSRSDRPVFSSHGQRTEKRIPFPWYFPSSLSFPFIQEFVPCKDASSSAWCAPFSAAPPFWAPAADTVRPRLLHTMMTAAPDRRRAETIIVRRRLLVTVAASNPAHFQNNSRKNSCLQAPAFAGAWILRKSPALCGAFLCSCAPAGCMQKSRI